MSQVSFEVEQKIERAVSLIGAYNGAVVALSAGVDSSLVAFLAHRAMGNRAVAVTGVSESLPADELELAKQTAKAIGIRHLTVLTNELQDADYASNPGNRCYYCKKTLYKELRTLADDLGLQVILDGTQLDDLGDDRPGFKAANEANVFSPLLQASLSKSEVREAARHFGLSVWDKPAMPCLSSRISHGEQITPHRLRMVEDAESYIKTLTGVRILRVRYSNSSARIEVSPNERRIFFDDLIMDQIDSELRRLGFESVTLDLRGYPGKKTAQVKDTLVLPMAV